MKNNRFVTDPKTALEKSIEMWEWLVEHPDKEKEDYFVEKNIFYEDRPWAECYLCEYCDTVREEHTHCEMCPVDWTGKGNYESRYRCEKAGSPYEDWKNHEDNVEYAKKVLDLLKNSLKNLDKFEKMWYNTHNDTEETE